MCISVSNTLDYHKISNTNVYCKNSKILSTDNNIIILLDRTIPFDCIIKFSHKYLGKRKIYILRLKLIRELKVL